MGRQNKEVRKVSIGNIVFFVACAVLAVSSVLLTIETATSSLEIARMEKISQQLSDTRRGLEESLVRSTSTRELQDKSAGLGFVKPVNLVYITSAEPVAKLP